MSYIILECGFLTHPKVRKLGDDHDALIARSVYLAAILYARQHLTDGHIPHHALADLDPLVTREQADYALNKCRIAKLVTRRRGRFGGWDIVNYDKRQQTKEEVEAAKTRNRERKRREREKKRENAGHGVTGDASRCDTSVTGGGVTLQETEAEERERPVLQGSNALRLVARDGTPELPASVIDPFDKAYYAKRLLSYCRHKDAGTESVVLSYVDKLPPAAFVNVTEKLRDGRSKIKNDGAFANAELKRIAKEKGVA